MKPVEANDGRLISVVFATGRSGVAGGRVADGGQRHLRVETAVVAFDLQVHLALQLDQTGRFHAQTRCHPTQLQQTQDHVTRFPVQHCAFKSNSLFTVTTRRIVPITILIIAHTHTHTHTNTQTHINTHTCMRGP